MLGSNRLDAGEYGLATAQHYAAYRPPLHDPILRLALGEGEGFSYGLDVGCGTGHSTLAAAKWCEQVVGIEPMQAMLAYAKEAKRVTYLHQRAPALPANFDPVTRFDLATFAGSLFYRNAKETARELSTLLGDSATIIVYDFDVDLSGPFAELDFQLPPSSYDHQRNFRDCGLTSFKEISSRQADFSFTTTPAELAHLLLSVSAWRQGIPVFVETERLLRGAFGASHALSARAYYTRYRFSTQPSEG